MPPQPPLLAPENHPIDLWDTVGPPPFPLDVLPKIVENYAVTMAYHMGAPASGIAMSALTVMSAAIPDRIKIQVKKHNAGWLESARLWTMLIGPPSSKKSPIISSAISPLARMDSSLFRQWQEQHKAWAALKKEERLHAPEPLQRRLRIEDTTVEAAQEVLKGSLNGILCAQDELSGWFGMMEKYGSAKGAAADRAFWLRAYNGGEFSLNRVGRGDALIENLSISLLGGIQPGPLRKIATEAVDDGLIQRMIPIMLHPCGTGMDRPIPDVQGTYDFTIQTLVNVVVQDGPLRFDEDAQILRQVREKENNRLMSAEIISPQFASHIGKFDGLFARLCVLWHAIENCGQILLPSIVTYETAERVDKFMKNFLVPHVACFYSSLGYSDDYDRIKAVAAHVLAHRLEKVTVRDVQRGTRAMRKISKPDVLPVLQQLVAFNWLAEEQGPRASSDPIFIVNPYVHHLYSQRGERERIRREGARKVMQECFHRK